jgi:hypothetical protein
MATAMWMLSGTTPVIRRASAALDPTGTPPRWATPPPTRPPENHSVITGGGSMGEQTAMDFS